MFRPIQTPYIGPRYEDQRKNKHRYRLEPGDYEKIKKYDEMMATESGQMVQRLQEENQQLMERNVKLSDKLSKVLLASSQTQAENRKLMEKNDKLSALLNEVVFDQ